MEWLKGLALLFIALLFGCTSQGAGSAQERPVSVDGEVALFAGENYSVGEPIAFQLRTSNYSIAFLNRSGGYSLGSYPSVWICRLWNGTCENVEYRRMKDFGACGAGGPVVNVPSQGEERYGIYPAELYDLLLRWDQKEWKEVKEPCAGGYVSVRKPVQVPPGNYSVTFVYWVSWSKEPRSVTADFRIV